MATTGAKNQPIVQNTDTFNPVSDINTLSNWVANNYASVKIIAAPSTKSSITGADLFTGLTVYEAVNDLFWYYTGSAWVLLPMGGVPRIELTQTATQASYFTTAVTRTLSTWTTTSSRGGMSVSAGVVTVPYAGRYNVYASFAFDQQTTASGQRILQIANAAGVAWRVSAAPVNAFGSYMSIAIPGLVCTAGDTLALAGFQTSGSSLAWISSASIPSRFVVEYVGA